MTIYQQGMLKSKKHTWRYTTVDLTKKEQRDLLWKRWEEAYKKLHASIDRLVDFRGLIQNDIQCTKEDLREQIKLHDQHKKELTYDLAECSKLILHTSKYAVDHMIQKK